MVYRTLIESKTDYVTFLCPSIADALHAFDCLLQRFFQYCLGIRARQSQIPLQSIFVAAVVVYGSILEDCQFVQVPDGVRLFK